MGGRPGEPKCLETSLYSDPELWFGIDNGAGMEYLGIDDGALLFENDICRVCVIADWYEIKLGLDAVLE